MAKKAAKAELLQEWSEPNKSWSLLQSVILEQRARPPVYLSLSRETLCRPEESGRLEPWQNCGPLPQKLPKPPSFPFFQSGRRIGFFEKADRRDGSSQVTCTVWDTEEEGPRTLFWQSESRIWYARLYLLDGGDFLSWSQRWDQKPGLGGNRWELARRGPDGSEKWSLELCGAVPLIRKNGVWLLTESKDDRQDYVWIDMEDGREKLRQRRSGHRKAFHFDSEPDDLWVVESDGRGGNPIVHLDTGGKEAARTCLPAPFTHVGWGISGVVRGDWMVCYVGGQDLALLDRDSLTLRGMVADGRKYRTLELDGAGRLWVYAGGMAECYDQRLNRLARRRLKGKPVGSHLDRDGNLCVVTYHPKEEWVRVYRLT